MFASDAPVALEDLAARAGLDPDELREYLYAEVFRRDRDWLPPSLCGPLPADASANALLTNGAKRNGTNGNRARR